MLIFIFHQVYDRLKAQSKRCKYDVYPILLGPTPSVASLDSAFNELTSKGNIHVDMKTVVVLVSDDMTRSDITTMYLLIDVVVVNSCIYHYLF
jgi:hypothetical protein